ncbi:hypothetical protein BH10BAC2_BH10BAC2_33560 [soil metagenome]
MQGYYLTSTTSAIPQNDGTYPATSGGNQYNVNDMGIYTQGNYHTKSGIGITLGARLDYNQVRRDGGLGYHLSPRFVIDYSIKDWVFKGIISHGIENVSNYTKFDDVNIAPNPALKPETINNYEVSASKKISDAFMADIDFYYSSIRNVVSAVVFNRILQNQNIGEFKIRGIQSNLYFKSPDKRWKASLNYTFTDPLQTKSVDTLDNVVNVDLRVPDIAAHKVNAVVNYLFLKKININFRANYLSGKKNGLNTTAPANKINFPAYIIGNTTLSFLNLAKGGTLQLGCNNIFNKTYFSPGIRTAGGVRVPNSILQMGRSSL